MNARERFFGQTVLAQAARGKHPEIVRWLLERGSTDADGALTFAVDTGDVALAKRALASGHLEPLDLRAYQKLVEAKDSKASPEIRALLAGATVTRPERKPFTADPEAPGRLRRTLRRRRQRARGDGDRARQRPVGRDHRPARAGADGRSLPTCSRTRPATAQVSFFGRAGTIEAMTVNRDGDVSALRRPAAATPPGPAQGGAGAGREGGAHAGPALAVVPRPATRPAAATARACRWPGTSRGARTSASRPRCRASRSAARSSAATASSSPPPSAARATRRSAPASTATATRWTTSPSTRSACWRSTRRRAPSCGTARSHKAAPTVKRHLKSSQANATPATDGKRVVVLFGTVGVLAAYDFDGKELWRRDVGVLDCNDPQAGAAAVGPRQLAHPLRRPRDRAGRPRARTRSWPPTGCADRRAGVARGARRAVHLGDAQRPARAVAGDELVTNGQTIRAYDPRDRQAAVDAGAQLRGGGRHAGGGRRAWPSSPPAIRRCGRSTRCGPASAATSPCPRASARARPSPGATRAAAPTSPRRCPTAASSTP